MRTIRGDKLKPETMERLRREHREEIRQRRIQSIRRSVQIADSHADDPEYAAMWLEMAEEGREVYRLEYGEDPPV